MTAEAGLIVSGTVNREGRLIAADPRLLALHVGAGGVEGGQLAVPQLATLARLARTLGVLVSRGVIAADGLDDIDLWVRAQPNGNEVKLSIAGWDKRPAAPPAPSLPHERAQGFARLEQDGIWSFDGQLLLTHIDDGLTVLLGQEAQNSLQLPLTRSFRLFEDDNGDLPILTAVTSMQGFAMQLAELKQSPSVRLLLNGEPIKLPSGEFGGYNCGYRLIERALVARKTDLPNRRMEDKFANTLDAALRGPIGRIISSADMIYERGDGPLRHDYTGYAGDISSAGRHLLGLVDDLVDLQAVDRPDFAIANEAVDLADVARRAAGLLAVRAADRGVKIDGPASDEILMGQGDFRRLLQILVNLIGNAVRYSPEGSAVWVRAEEEDDLIAIIVADQGKGIAQENHARIFEKFERVDTSEPGGSGLGLYISRKLARAMRGDITVDSAPGQGARFILTLPR